MAGATAGTLTFMVGGDSAVFEESKEVLAAMGKNMVHVGAPGTGGVTKLCNNLGLAIHMVGTAEAMNLVSGTQLHHHLLSLISFSKSAVVTDVGSKM